jgi:hypothetical protein
VKTSPCKRCGTHGREETTVRQGPCTDGKVCPGACDVAPGNSPGEPVLPELEVDVVEQVSRHVDVVERL